MTFAVYFVNYILNLYIWLLWRVNCALQWQWYLGVKLFLQFIFATMYTLIFIYDRRYMHSFVFQINIVRVGCFFIYNFLISVPKIQKNPNFLCAFYVVLQLHFWIFLQFKKNNFHTEYTHRIIQQCSPDHDILSSLAKRKEITKYGEKKFT